jgi:hypothetical protein
MALTPYQRDICRLIAKTRIELGESYIAGGVALNEFSHSLRISDDIDLFHDVAEAVTESFAADSQLLQGEQYAVDIKRKQSGFIEAAVTKGIEATTIQWTSDSAYRFFPLIPHADFGLTLHPIDLATNKVLALVGRLKARDWVDLIGANAAIQPLGYLAWAACGKDLAFSPGIILAESKRSARYTAVELTELQFDGEPPDAAELARKWRTIIAEAEEIVSVLPGPEAGKCVLQRNGEPFTGNVEALQIALEKHAVCFHEGRIRGAFPSIQS